MDDAKVLEEEKVDFLTAEVGPDAADFRFEQPSGSQGDSSPKIKKDVLAHAPTGRSEIDRLTEVRDELRGLGSETEKSLGQTILIFGQGPVITDEKRPRVNYWSEDLSRSAAELKRLDPNIKDYVVMGGQTGGPDNPSEADLIAYRLKRFGIDENTVSIEGLSNDTIENIVNFLNLSDNTPDFAQRKFSILTAPYHSGRTEMLMQLFKIPVENSFTTEGVMRYAAHIPKGEQAPSFDASKWNQKKLQTIDDKVNINDPTKYSSTRKSASEQRDVLDRYVKDNLWTRELIEFPEKWLPYIGKINNSERVSSILAQVEEIYPGMLKEKYGILLPENPDETTLDAVKVQLSNIPPYKGLTDETVTQWVNENKTEGWPEETTAIRDKLLNLRNTTAITK